VIIIIKSLRKFPVYRSKLKHEFFIIKSFNYIIYRFLYIYFIISEESIRIFFLYLAQSFRHQILHCKIDDTSVIHRMSRKKA